jgi:hypothetical protein
VLVPSCDFSKEDILSAYQKLQITPSLSELLAQIADTIIPSGKIKGAKDLSVQDFILVMVNDCVDEEGQKSFMAGIQGFEAFSESSAGKAFSKLEVSQRESLLQTGLALEDEKQKHIKDFLSMAKRFTIQGFMLSEYIQTEVKPYSLIPGEYKDVLIADLKPERIHG